VIADEPLWHSPPINLVLSKDVVHIWRTDLNLPESQIQSLAKTLAPDEHNRANRFYFERDRKHFIAGRGILRSILGRYLSLEPAQLQLSYASRGKPTLANLDRGETLSFNLSHSHELAIYAIAHTSWVGIDLEHIRPMDKVEQLVKRFFSPREYAVICSLPDDQKQEAFFRAWTCKEAYLKAIGDGLPGLDGVEVSLTPGEPAALLSIQGDEEAASRWSVYPLIPAPGYMAALAVEGQDWSLEYLKFE
jgi:4'-phosphopantetheinyl transferase